MPSFDAFALRAFYNPTALLALALMAVIVMMILPMPAVLLDVGLTVSFSLAILVFMTTLFIERPLDFSAFPTVLLASLVLRLSLNVSSTKLIIGQGHTGTDAAGGVIEGFANFIMGGNLLLGVVTFGVLLIVNFMVITKGAGRMAEVGARFALDGMPGKQLAIDSDMSAGAITHDEASRRRKLEQEETTFFGSLDGASKFVKGDAVAGLLITFLNLIVGMAMGTIYYDMPMGAAFETYAILTVGDGLVSQIPSVIISVAAALLIAKGGALGSADKTLMKQLGAHPQALGVVALLLAIFALFPGLPFGPFVVAAAGMGALAYYGHREQRRAAEAAEAEAAKTEQSSAATPETLGDHLDLDEIRVEFAKGLIPLAMDQTNGIVARIGNMRRNIATEFGFITPDVRLTDNPYLDGHRYAIKLHGVEIASGEVVPKHVLVIKQDAPLAIPGQDVAEPVYGAPARWIEERRQAEAEALGLPVASPNEVLATHLMEVIKDNMHELLNRQALARLLDEFVNVSNPEKAEANRRLLDELVPDPVPRDVLQATLRTLLAEQVSVRNLPLILEGIAEGKAQSNDLDTIVEVTRRKLAMQITRKLLGADGLLPAIHLTPEWEALFRAHEVRDDAGRVTDMALAPSDLRRLSTEVANKIKDAASRGHYPAILVPANRRRMVRTLLEATGLKNPVLAFEELGTRVRPNFVGAV